jgi:hypothetical protein
MRTRQRCNSIATVVLCAAMSALTVACASSSSETYSSAPAEVSPANPPAAQPASSGAAESGFAGVWQGTTLATCAAFSYRPSRCNAEQKVTITLLEGSDGKFSGRYTCAYGNMDCYHENTTGKVIDVTFANARMTVRVLMPDGTSCIYTGIDVNQSINGGYTCYQGGGLIEQGSWLARRSY